MLNPNEQAKGGFGARAEREQERRDALAKARAEGGIAGEGTDAPGDAATQADGASADQPAANGEVGANVPPTGRQPKRWH